MTGHQRSDCPGHGSEEGRLYDVGLGELVGMSPQIKELGVSCSKTGKTKIPVSSAPVLQAAHKKERNA